ncbi:EAL domain-containing protein [Vibrio parahaemolyticus]|uniref:EAL and HDOD domain-containing protein n=1 Tax=Vibrio parahaemolyticus TaxID=670 RepID=UPI00041DC2CA|nr:EAL and HDOD domain-containing protein [Vibrio parahaemolyticus]EGR1751930.1 EAL domain-containing protein [Vibrio parahaemolyticus]EME0905542.1 EAL domain-containing protein [Vibrio parahaemolyticus]MBE5155278.1 EAL domain-containing protein [Vibrio parahaemolyticus]MBE5164604.1 EAL domain-containing protein [Vibrio parahaemolyticus]MDF4666867.1 EAL domain-containing protein [Vibrio parahaemolyticus]
MNTTYVARQPIFNRKRQTLGYELLFRDGESNAYPAHIESNRATYRLIVENFLSLGTNPVIASSRCFINFPHQSLVRRLPRSLPKNKIVVEVLETCQPTDDLLDAIRELYREGYLIALDDFTLTPEWRRFLPYVHIVKLDIMAMGLEKACELVKTHLAKRVKYHFLAERVETAEEFEQAKAAGFKFFQGYFFSKPLVSQTKYISPEQVLALQLFREVCAPEPDFDRIESIITQDVALSYKLLRFVNTQITTLEVEISSFRQALIYLGQDKLKQFVSLVVASYISSNKPRELYNLSLQRAQFCELMSRYQPFSHLNEQGFMVGLLSILDAMLDLSIEALVKQLPLSDSVQQALLHRKGEYGVLISLEECYERADWHGVEKLSGQLGLSFEEVKASLSEAVRWSQSVVAV